MLQSTYPKRLVNKERSFRDVRISLRRESRRDFMSGMRVGMDRNKRDQDRVEMEEESTSSILVCVASQWNLVDLWGMATLKSFLSSSSYQWQIASLLEDRFCVYLQAPCWEIFWLGLAWVLHMHVLMCVTGLSSYVSLSFFAQKLWFLAIIYWFCVLWSFCLLFHNDPWSLEEKGKT